MQAKFLERNEEIQPHDSTQWLYQLSQMISNNVLQHWNLRNKALHNSENQIRDEEINQRIKNFYALQDRVDELDRGVFRCPLEDMLELPITRRENWLSKIGPFLKTQIRAAKTRLETQTQDTRRFFKKNGCAFCGRIVE
jgi:hypothetical protein